MFVVPTSVALFSHLLANTPFQDNLFIYFKKYFKKIKKEGINDAFYVVE